MIKYKKFLLEKYNSFDYIVEKWFHGQCIPFAVALKEIFPQYELAVLIDVYDVEDEDLEYNYNFVHAFCYDSKNHKVIIDAKGVRSLNDLYDDYYDINPEIIWDVPSPKYLIDEFSGKEFYSEESYEYDINEYIEAKEWILNNIEKYKID